MAGGFDRDKFKRGWMPPHPAFFCKRSVYEKYGLLNLEGVLPK
jgi:glycosyltransferase